MSIKIAAPATAKKYRLSPTTGLSLFNDCPKCFWLHYNANTQRPRGIFPSLPGGMDGVIKSYFDRYRGSLPPELVGKVRGMLVKDQNLLDRWRDWRTGMEAVDSKLGATLFGALDDCLVDGDVFIPLDYKTRGSAPKDGDSQKYYQTQLDSYALMLTENGFKAGREGFLIYYYPEKVSAGGAVSFVVEPVRIEVDAERARTLFHRAVETLRGPMPDRSENCEYCTWLGKRVQTIQAALFN